MQQCLPFTVLKHISTSDNFIIISFVATVLTVYGIETLKKSRLKRKLKVATVLTVYGIETHINIFCTRKINGLQQCLPFTVLKLKLYYLGIGYNKIVATVLTVYGIETYFELFICFKFSISCNSAYRLRYWNLQEFFFLFC